MVIDRRDSASGMPKSIVISLYFDWEHDRPPRTPLSDSIIYEMHVRGFSMLNEQSSRGPAWFLRRTCIRRRR